jgi:hypothetical protein
VVSWARSLACGRHGGSESQAALRSAQPPTVSEADWGEAHARLEDLKHRLGEPVWAQALARVTDTDRALIDCLLTGVLDT